VYAYRLGGRSWSDVSRALPTGRSQGLVAGSSKQGASRKEARKLPPDAEHEPGEGETVRVSSAHDQKYALVRPVGFGSQVLDTTEGVLGLKSALP